MVCSNHVAFVISPSPHFLTNIREKLQQIKNSFVEYKLYKEEMKDLVHWFVLLKYANIEIMLNGLMLRHLSSLTFSETCPVGLGGFTSTDQGWRLRINLKESMYGDYTSNNLIQLMTSGNIIAQSQIKGITILDYIEASSTIVIR